MTPQLVYLAAPYSHPDPERRRARFEAINRVAARLMADGVLIFSPISHTHPIALAGGLPTDFAYWERYLRAVLPLCRRMLVLKLEEWQFSEGIKQETLIAAQLGIPVELIDP